MKKTFFVIPTLMIISFFATPLLIGVQAAEPQPLEFCTIRTSFTWRGTNYGSLTAPPTTGIATTGVGMPCIIDIIKTLTNWLTAILVFLVALFVAWAALDYLTSSGEPKKMESAKNKMLFAGIALVIMLLSRMFVPIIREIVGG